MINLGAIGYLAVCAFYALLALLLLTTWRGGKIGIYLIVASLISVIWGFLLAAQATNTPVHPGLVSFIEMARTSAWVMFLVRLNAQLGTSRLLRWSSALAALLAVAAIPILAVGGSKFPFEVISLRSIVIPAGLTLALLGLILIEQLYRNSSGEARWMLKPLVLGIGAMFAYDLFLYSQGVLLKVIDPTTWMARGLVNVFFVPMIAIAARRNTDWEMPIFVSRHVIFYTTTLVAVGAYLLLMSFGGYVIVRYGGSWGGLARIVFFAGAAIVLLTLLFSSTLRKRLKVFLNKHFFHNKYDYREEWLRLVATLAEFETTNARHVAVKAIAQIVESPAGIMWDRDDANSEYRMSARFETEDDYPDIGVNEPLIKFIEESGWLIDFAEYKRSPDRYGDLKLPDWLLQRNYPWLLVPLQSSGQLLALILLHKAPGPLRLNYEDRDLLKTVGNHIAVHLAQAKSDSMLAEAQQFEAYNRLTAFLMHDLNNLIAQQSLIVSNAEKHKRNPEFVDDAITTIAGSVERMKRVMTQLKTGRSDASPRLTDLRFVASAAVDRCTAHRPVPNLDPNGVDAKVAVDGEEFTMILAHLIRNAQDASSSDGVVKVSLRQGEHDAFVMVEDDGVGMSEDFVRDRLFRPFDTTKGNQGMGIGAYQAREFARKLGGDLKVESRQGAGTKVTLSIPLG